MENILAVLPGLIPSTLSLGVREQLVVVLLITAKPCYLVMGHFPTVTDTDCQGGWIFFFFFTLTSILLL